MDATTQARPSALQALFRQNPSLRSAVLGIVAGAAAVAPAAQAQQAPVRTAAAVERDAGHRLVEAAAVSVRMAQMPNLLEGSTRRCLANQMRMLSPEGVGRDPALAVSRRFDALDADRAQDLAYPVAVKALHDPAVPESLKDVIEHHVGLREACLRWADRTVALFRDSTAHAATTRLTERLDEAKAMAARDLIREAFGDGREFGVESLSGMETYAQRF